MPRKPTQPERRPHAARLSITAVLCSAATAALAQTPPDAGRLLEETRPQRPAIPPQTAPKRLLETPARPTVEMKEGVTVVPSAFRITGAVSFPAEELAELIKPWVGRRLDLAGLNEAAGAITRRYQTAGHLLSYAYLPAQRVADGVIEIAVLEGRLDGVQVVNAQDVRLRDEVVQAHVGDLVDAKPLLQADVERRLLLLNDLPGVVARGAFTPGASQGSAEMVVSVAEDEPLAVEVTADNHGSPSSGRYRGGLGLTFKDLFGWGDFTQANFLTTNRGALSSGSLSTLVPVGGQGVKIGASLSSLHYQLGGTFKALDAQGNAQSIGLKIRVPVFRSADANLALEGSLEHKRLRDEVFLIGQNNPKASTVGIGSLVFDWRDSLGGLTGGSISPEAGEMKLLDEAQRNADAAGPQTNGGFKKGNVALARQQALFGPVSAYLRFNGQFARRNLDSSEKIALGGPSAVRAYAPGEAVVDDGRIYSAELRYSLDYLGGNLLWSVFYDRALGRINHFPIATGNDVVLSGSGLGLQWNGGDYGLATSLAWRGGSRVPTAEGGDKNPRVYLQLFYAP